MQNVKYFLRYGLNKVKNVVILSNLKISLQIFITLQKTKKWLVDFL